jgi:hypothetical protein
MDGLQWEHGNIILNSASKEERNNKGVPSFLKIFLANKPIFNLPIVELKAMYLSKMSISSVIHQHNRPMVIKFKLKSGIGFSNSSMRINSANCIYQIVLRSF